MLSSVVVGTRTRLPAAGAEDGTWGTEADGIGEEGARGADCGNRERLKLPES
jgi:hypothetical protein